MSDTDTAAAARLKAILKPRPLILYADGNRVLLHFVTDVLELSGYRIEHFPGGVITRAEMMFAAQVA